MMTGKIIKLPGVSDATRAPKGVRSRMDTVVLTPEGVQAWKKPPFQRELRVTSKVLEVAEQIKQTGVVEGVLTLGVLDGETYLVDGQHRVEAFVLSQLQVVYADVRICEFTTMAEMSEEFRRLNSSLVRMKNDDIVRASEAAYPGLTTIRRRCPFVGYSRVRQHGSRVLVSMANIIRLWFGSNATTPTGGPSSPESVKLLDETQAVCLSKFMQVCYEAWGEDKEHYTLWSSVNLGVLMWLWRRVVSGTGLPAPTLGRATALTVAQFQKCLMSLGSDPLYADWLVGRTLREKDRAPCYAKIRLIFTRRLAMDGVRNARFPQEEWSK